MKLTTEAKKKKIYIPKETTIDVPAIDLFYCLIISKCFPRSICHSWCNPMIMLRGSFWFTGGSFNVVYKPSPPTLGSKQLLGRSMLTQRWRATIDCRFLIHSYKGSAYNFSFLFFSFLFSPINEGKRIIKCELVIINLKKFL